VLRLGRQVHPLVREAALPALRALAEDIGATAHLTLVDGTEALAVAVVEPTWTDYHVAYRAGFRHPLDRGAAGRAILSARRTPPDDLGYTLTHGELEAGASGAAAPLLGVTGVEGSVGVVMLADAVPERVGARVVDAAREVAEALR
jgi:DNA-binding IclR family transcriptional regulator